MGKGYLPAIKTILPIKQMKLTLKIASAACLALLSSCYQMQPIGKDTVPLGKVELADDNYRVLATRISGEDTGFSLLPIAGTAANILTLGFFQSVIPGGIEFKSPSESNAIKQLYQKSGANQTGRATQLINMRKEIGGYNYLIFGRPKVRVTADLIEFTR